MSSINVSKSSCKHSCDKCLSPGTNNISLDENDLPIRTNDININGNSYVNTPSPSSIASTSTNDPPFKYRSKRKDDFHLHMPLKRRSRHEKGFHYAHSLNRQYVITMTNILFQMQKEIFKLKKRTNHVEQMLVNQTQSGLPIIRIPRLTRDEISTICVNNHDKEQDIPSTVTEENENNHESSSSTIENIEPSNEQIDDIENSIKLQAESPTNIIEINNQPIQQSTPYKYCSACNHEFSHRSAYLRHMRRLHEGTYPTASNNDNLLEVENSNNEAIILTTDQSVNETENESFQVLFNQWDIGEGRLRPRRVSKSKEDPVKKVKCDVCNKFFRADYLKKHQRRTHRASKSSPCDQSNNTLDETTSSTTKPIDEIPTNVDQSPVDSIDPPSTITVAEMDIDDIPIRFRKESNKPIVIAVTCLQRYQLDIIEEFIQKFSPRISQVSSIDSRTTHLIANDDQHNLRSPLSIKLIEGIANHCFCVSYRWIIDCLKYDRIIDETPYEIEGDDTDYHPQGGPKRSRSIEKRNSLFENICFMIKCAENSDIKMTNARLQDLITTCGGKIITCVTQSLLNEYEIVVLCDRVYVSERRHNYDQCRSLGIHFVSSDWVLESILEYRQKLFSLYEETPL